MNPHPYIRRQVLTGIVCFVAGLAAAIGSSGRAEPYLVVGLGKGELQHEGSNKWWIQKGWDYTIDEKSAVWNLGLGWKFNKYFSAELNYHDLGDYHHFAGFMVEEDIYDANSPTLCTGPCEPTQWGYLQGSVTAWSLSILPRIPVWRDLSVFGRYGVASVGAKFKAFISPKDLTSRKYQEVNVFSERVVSEILGMGITYKSLSIEWQQLPSLVAKRDGCCSAYTSGQNVSVSYRLHF